MIRAITKILSFIFAIFAIILTGVSPKINEQASQWVIIVLIILFSVLSASLQCLPPFCFKNSKNLVWKIFLKCLYKNPFPDQLQLTMSYKVHIDTNKGVSTDGDRLEEIKENILTGQKEAEWRFTEDDSNRFVIQQTTDNVTSIASCIGITKISSKKIVFYFKYDAEGKISLDSLEKVPSHKGLMKVILENNKILEAEYWNNKPSYGTLKPNKNPKKTE